MWRAIKSVLFCEHDWQWLRNAVDGHAKNGYRHPTSVHICTKCGKLKTLEHK